MDAYMQRYILSFSLLLTAPLVHTAEVFVLESNASNYPSQQRLNTSSTIRLAQGELVKLMSTAGNVCTMRGPINGPICRSSSPAGGSGGLSGGRFKGSNPRGANDVQDDGRTISDADSIWYVDIELTEPQCIEAGALPKLWRKYADLPLALTLADSQETQSTELSWPLDMHTMDWPDAITFTNGASYQINVADFSYKLEIHEISAEAINKVAELQEKGCLQQAVALAFESKPED